LRDAVVYFFKVVFFFLVKISSTQWVKGFKTRSRFGSLPCVEKTQ